MKSAAGAVCSGPQNSHRPPTRRAGGAWLADLGRAAACGAESRHTAPGGTSLDDIVTAATVTEPADRLDSVPTDPVTVEI